MKVYARAGQLLVAAADADLIGRTLQEGEMRLQVGDFYAGEVVDEDAFLEQVQNSTMGNFVGEETIAVCLRHHLIQESGVLRIEGVPHAQLYVL